MLYVIIIICLQQLLLPVCDIRFYMTLCMYVFNYCFFLSIFLHSLSERLVRMKSIQEQISSLESTNKELKEEETKLKEQLSRVERELSMLRSEVSKSESQANNIYLNLSKLCSDWVGRLGLSPRSYISLSFLTLLLPPPLSY